MERGAEREWVAEESIVVSARAEQVYDLVSDLRRTGEWSPECFKVLVRGGRGVDAGTVRPGTRFVGLNRAGARLWFTTGRVSAAERGGVFAFRVSSFGVPVALWGFRIEDIGPDGTRLTQYWEDLRRDVRGARVISVLGRLFTGVGAAERAAWNRAGMRASLARIKAIAEGPEARGKSPSHPAGPGG